MPDNSNCCSGQIIPGLVDGHWTTNDSCVSGSGGSNNGNVGGNTSALQTQIDAINGSIASINTQLTVLADQNSAQSTSITTLTATTGANTAAISTEVSARTSADAALSTSISTVSATTNTKNRTFIQSTTPAATAVGDLWIDTADGNKLRRWNGTSWVDTAVASGAIAAAVSTETTARTTATNALASQITSLTATVNGNTAAISTEAIARADADDALAATIATLQAFVGTTSTVFVQASAPTANAVNDLWLDSDDGLRPYYWNGTAWTNATDARLTGAIADITTEQSVRASADTALTNSLNSLTSTVNGNVSAIATIQSTYATQTFAETKKTEAIAASNSYAAGIVATETTARTTADSAMAADITALQASVGPRSTVFVQTSAPTANRQNDLWLDSDNGFRPYYWTGSVWAEWTDSRLTTAIADITNEQSVRATADTALTNSINTLTSTVNGNSSAIATIQSTYATQSFAETKKSEAIAASNSYADGVVATEASARASADSSFTSSLSSLTATVGTKARTFISSSAPTATATGDIWIDTANGNAFKRWNGASWVDTSVASGAIAAAVATESSARATADGNLSGKYTLTVAAGNVVTGMNITSASGPGTTVSDVTFQASSFKIKTDSSSAAPFTVTGNTVYMANATVTGTVDIGSGYNKTQITGSGLSACNGQFVLSSDISSLGGQLRVGAGINHYATWVAIQNTLANLSFYDGSGTTVLALGTTGVATIKEIQVKSSFSGTHIGTLKDNASGRFEISAQSSKSISFNTSGAERWIVGSDGHLKSFGGDVRKVSDDGWGPKMWDGSNSLEFRWDGGLQVRIDGTSVFDVTTT